MSFTKVITYFSTFVVACDSRVLH